MYRLISSMPRRDRPTGVAVEHPVGYRDHGRVSNEVAEDTFCHSRAHTQGLPWQSWTNARARDAFVVEVCDRAVLEQGLRRGR